jgi:hypothetical protein
MPPSPKIPIGSMNTQGNGLLREVRQPRWIVPQRAPVTSTERRNSIYSTCQSPTHLRAQLNLAHML